MTVWTIIPRDPLIFRDGKPFTADAGAKATSLPFPFPSTIAGAMRTHAGPDKEGVFSKERIEKLLAMEVRGPLLVELDKDNQIIEWLLPAPADALLTKIDNSDSKKANRHRLVPLQTPSNTETNIDELSLVGTPKPVKFKSLKNTPHYWTWTDYKKWLIAPKEKETTPHNIEPHKENRIHVGIDPKTGTGIPGALFQTGGLEFTHLLKSEEELYPNLQKARKLALALESNAPLEENFCFVGGERRVAQWKSSTNTLLDESQCPVDLSAKIIEAKACRLLLLTPAYFEKGNIPSRVLGDKVNLIAAVTPRYQVVSGWDYEKKRPKPTRRLTPAGSVYFIQFDDEESAEQFIKEIWLNAISDDFQSRRDGFGLTILGTWDGKLAKMEVQR